jgi:hypothetical protein
MLHVHWFGWWKIGKYHEAMCAGADETVGWFEAREGSERTGCLVWQTEPRCLRNF